MASQTLYIIQKKLIDFVQSFEQAHSILQASSQINLNEWIGDLVGYSV